MLHLNWQRRIFTFSILMLMSLEICSRHEFEEEPWVTSYPAGPGRCPLHDQWGKGGVFCSVTASRVSDPCRAGTTSHQKLEGEVLPVVHCGLHSLAAMIDGKGNTFQEPNIRVTLVVVTGSSLQSSHAGRQTVDSRFVISRDMRHYGGCVTPEQKRGSGSSGSLSIECFHFWNH